MYREVESLTPGLQICVLFDQDCVSRSSAYRPRSSPVIGKIELLRADNNYGYIKDQKYEVAVLPLGATEPHNLHLPYETDVFEASIMGDKICEVAPNEDGSLIADDGATNPTQIEALNQGWVSLARPWHLLTKNSGSGDPHAATAEKGQKMMDVLVERLGKFLVDLSNEKITNQFPY